MEIISLLIGLILLVVFIVMASNIGSILKTLKRIEVYLFSISNALDKIVGKLPPDAPDKLKEMTKAFDKGKP